MGSLIRLALTALRVSGCWLRGLCGLRCQSSWVIGIIGFRGGFSGPGVSTFYK